VAAAVFAASATVATSAKAEPCNVPGDCASGFCADGVCCDSACTDLCRACTAAKKGSGEDGTCGQVPSGALCEPAHCDGNAFAFVDDSFCDAAGECIAPAGVPCLVNDPCKFDLCGDAGCEQVTKLDGTTCGDGLACVAGSCGPEPSSSSATGSGSGSGSGNGSGGGAGGDAPGGAPGAGGSGQGAAGNADLYPPRDEDSGCGCRAGTGRADAGAALALCALILLGQRRRR
jgi:hypothetical protein